MCAILNEAASVCPPKYRKEKMIGYCKKPDTKIANPTQSKYTAFIMPENAFT